ncbi:hypothetical protein [Jidongwangia harbinensis]|uniref:hypothetical protein n=1 Tax=Jidongwangia harbinensis TaxID=2878561 RepID=UPI001CD9DD10|nr:hypothetical protein [Jidongwangia harbinensis]MCA2216646.1 hypothetical protein [Jidongwangia harbinensis]
MSEMYFTDTNGDGVGDVGQADTNGNGVADSFQVDANFDGYAEILSQDVDENGLIDNIQIDTNLDGVVDTAGVDVNGDTVLDLVANPATGGQFVTPTAPAPGPNPGLGDPSIIGGGGHDPLIDLIPFATPGQVDQINDIFDSRNDAIENILDSDDDDD